MIPIGASSNAPLLPSGPSIRSQRRGSLPSVNGSTSENRTRIYVIGAPEMAYVKVGRAKTVRTRFEQMQTGMPYRLRIFGAIFMPKWASVVVEWEAHQALTEMGFHFRGEWFDIDPADALAVVSKCADLGRFPHFDGLSFCDNLGGDVAFLDNYQRGSVDWLRDALSFERASRSG